VAEEAVAAVVGCFSGTMFFPSNAAKLAPCRHLRLSKEQQKNQ
jgi:hypothetical protein